MRRLTDGVTITLLILIVFLVIFAYLLPTVFGSRLAVVLSGSMEPGMPMGSLAVMSPVDPYTIEVGDIIAFNPPWESEATISHRVVEVLSVGFGTKGDANEAPDPYVIPFEDVIGKVSWHIPHAGYALSDIRGFATTIWGFLLVIVLPTILIFRSAVTDIVTARGQRRIRQKWTKRREQRLKRRGRRGWQLLGVGG